MLALVIAIGLLDYASGVEISLSVVYAIPISIVAWSVGARAAFALALVSVGVWMWGDFADGLQVSSIMVPVLNSLVRLIFYAFLAQVLVRLHYLQKNLEELAHVRAIALSRETTERERLERQMLEIAEREQRRIGQDLHDSLCQHLTATALAGQVLGEKLAAQSLPEEVDARRVVTLVEDGIALARNLARGLAPVELEAEGLMAAFRDLAKTTTSHFNIDCRFEAPHPVLIDNSATSTHLFRIAQEAVSNAIKHGRARQVTISLTQVAEDILLEVRDNGSGFREPPPDAQGMGLHIMRHRASMIGATLTIRRATPGTIVACRLRDEDQKEEAA